MSKLYAEIFLDKFDRTNFVVIGVWPFLGKMSVSWNWELPSADHWTMSFGGLQAAAEIGGEMG